MSILTTIKAESLKARKERNAPKAALLSTLLGEVQMIGKNNGNRESTDGETIAVIKKMLNNTTETVNLLLNSTDTGQLEALREELNVLGSFLPKQLSSAELTIAIGQAIAQTGATSIKEMGKVMKVLKEHHEGLFDGTEASKQIKEKLNVTV